MVDSFGTRLRERVRANGPLCVGIDPSSRLLGEWGRPDSPDGVEFFALSVIEAVRDVACAVKPQVSFFERFGAQGYRVLERVMAEARDADLLIVADAKRGDISSTNDGYAQAWLHDQSPLRADALTVTPYVGVGALSPFFDLARSTGRGIFVLTGTSNDEGRAIQTARNAADERVEDVVLDALRAINQRDGGEGTVGAVFGATRDRPRFDLSTLGGPYLVPGVGEQGASADHVARLFERCPEGSVLVNVGRAILAAGPERSALRDRTQRWRDDLVDALL